VGASAARGLHQVRDAAVLPLLDALEGERRARALPEETLAALVVVGRDAHGARHVEAVVGRGEASLFAVEVRVASRLAPSPCFSKTASTASRWTWM
jgi:hypothetical protein